MRLLLALLLILPAAAQTRLITPLDQDWRFTQSDPANAQSPTFDDTSWHTVQLPHDWSIAGPVAATNPSGQGGGFFPTGVAWYRKTITLTRLTPHKETWIAFDGITANSDVYCNGTFLGHHPSAYISFHYNLTPCLHAGINTIAVRTDTSQQPASRWYTGSGINRHVRLMTLNEVHIAPWGTVVTTPKVSAEQATIHIHTTVQNDSDHPAFVTLNVTLTLPSGKPLLTYKPITSKPALIAPHDAAGLEADVSLPHPDLWDIAHGTLHTITASIHEYQKPIADSETIPFGIREFHFDPNQGFFLNGHHHKIYGVALHTDAGPFGTAVPLAAWQRRLTALRALGVNAIRTAHNPPAPEFLDLCDRMGFLVMDEMFDTWTVGKAPYDYHLYFKQWYLTDTEDTVKRDRNHPSIILWSAGNEIHDTPHPEIAIPILKSLVATFHRYDPTRPVTQALFRPNASHDYEDGLADLLDVIGQNYREQEILKAHADKPTRAIIGTENTHVREQWVAMRDHPEYSGQFLWTGVDYLGEAGHWPAIGAGSGLLLTTSEPRARAYERQSWWTETPMVIIARRIAPQQKNPTDPGYEAPNQPTATRLTPTLLMDWTPTDQTPHTETVEIYTNAEEVELTLNGTSLGTQKLHPDASPIVYQVPFTPGTLNAIAYNAGKPVTEDMLKTAGKPHNIVIADWFPPVKRTLDHLVDHPPTPDWDDVTFLTAHLVDAEGWEVPDSSTPIHFTATGPGKIIATDNGNLLDHTPYQSPTRTTYQGTAQAILRATAPTGQIQITATAEGLPPTTLTLHAAPPQPQPEIRSF
jgi:beta-galactosidase